MLCSIDINLSADERRVFDRLFNNADEEQLGVLTGDKAVPFFEASDLPGQVRCRSSHPSLSQDGGAVKYGNDADYCYSYYLIDSGRDMGTRR
jgi:hypothetical protein